MLYTSLRLVSESLLHHQADVGNEVTNLIPLTLVSQCTNQSPLSIEIIGQSFFGRVFFPRVDVELFNLSSFETTDQAVKVDNNSFTGFYDLFTRHMSFPIAFHRVESINRLNDFPPRHHAIAYYIMGGLAILPETPGSQRSKLPKLPKFGNRPGPFFYLPGTSSSQILKTSNAIRGEKNKLFHLENLGTSLVP